MHRFLLPALGIAMLAGCSHPVTPATTLTLTPGAIPDCGVQTKPVSLAVHWDASKALSARGGVKVWINNQPINAGIFSNDNLGTLWSQSGPVGSSTTGPWMKPGSRITVTNVTNGNVLAQLDVPAAPCHP
ncbi:MAG TPA: hypothetical protein VF284_01540 [Rhodanobacteraceae bacterium]